ncbi:hypothetical protein IP88_12940 [alpha proteobacterium AAP81b]|nr:hypothetical protein IP88_12940 [alpha proteobacterium AAP81b]
MRVLWGLLVLLPAAVGAQEVPDREPAPPPRAAAPAEPAQGTPPPPADAPPPAGSEPAYAEKDVVAAAEDVFGRGAKGLAEIIERTFKSYGRPNAYIVGREGGGAFIVGLRYGAGTLYHKVEGNRDVHWSGPSLGFDVGGDGNRVFALVYNLWDSDRIFQRFPAAEGKAYLVGGFTANYLQRGDVIIVPIKLGAGWRLGINGGYMKFTRKGTVIPF